MLKTKFFNPIVFIFIGVFFNSHLYGNTIDSTEITSKIENPTSKEDVVDKNSNVQVNDWTYLLDDTLEQWEIWMGVVHSSVDLPDWPHKEDNVTNGKPLGLNNDPKNVFSVITENGEKVLKITGEIYGGLTTLENYKNYHFSTQFKWGTKKWEPRLNALRDSGLLYHCVGEHGSFWKVWKSSLEMQVQEGDCGDFISLGPQAFSQARDNGSFGTFEPGQPLIKKGRIIRSEDRELANGEWNTLEIITVGNRSIHLVNGYLVNALENATYQGSPITEGQIQIQSEGAELYYKDIKIKTVTDFPEEHKITLGWSTQNQVLTDGPYYLESPFSEQRLFTSGTINHNAEMTNKSSATNQIWDAVHLGDNVYTFKNRSTDRFLEVPQAICENSANVGTWVSGNNNHQRWRVSMDGDTFILKPLHCETHALDRVNGAQNANSVIFMSSAANDNQKWSIVPAETTPVDDVKVLVFTKTNGFRHPSITQGVAMIKNLGNQNGLWTADDTGNANAFTEENLAQYKAVVFCNTSGNNLLNASQRQAFENFIANGGGFVGIHAATDTYRDRSWPFYNELVGAIVQGNRPHTANNFQATMTVENSHPSVDFLGTSWTKREEYYYWKNNGGQLFDGNITLLEVERTGSNDFDEARPISWFKEYGGGRSFYTALGHNPSDYTDDNNFIRHVEEGIKYAIGDPNTLSVGPYNRNDFEIRIDKNPVEEVLAFSIPNKNLPKDLYIYDIHGQLVVQEEVKAKDMAMNVSYLPRGFYLGKLVSGNSESVFKFIKN